MEKWLLGGYESQPSSPDEQALSASDKDEKQHREPTTQHQTPQ